MADAQPPSQVTIQQHQPRKNHTIMNEHLFKLTSLWSYTEGDSVDGYRVQAAYILNAQHMGPASEFVILESAFDMTGEVHKAHFYASKAELHGAFIFGLLGILQPQQPKTLASIVDHIVSCGSTFARRPGYIFSIFTTEPDQKPWPMAQKGDEIGPDGIATTIHPAPTA